jgi:hypothetical protein
MSAADDYFTRGLQKFPLGSIMDNEDVSVNPVRCNTYLPWFDRFLIIPLTMREAFNEGLPSCTSKNSVLLR